VLTILIYTGYTSLAAPLGSGTLTTTPVTIPAISSGTMAEVQGQGTGGHGAGVGVGIGVSVGIGAGGVVGSTTTNGSAVFSL